MRSGLVMLLSAAVLGCSNPVSPRDALQIETSVSAPTIRPGEPVTVSVVVTNRGGRTQQIQVESGFCPAASFVVTQGDGTPIRPAGAICSTALPRPKELGPGESITLTSRWFGDLHPEASMQAPSSTSMLPAGTYRVRGSALVHGFGLLEGPPVELRIVR